MFEGMTSMEKATFFLSVFGALAWLMPFFSWLNSKYFNAPQISIHLDKILFINHSENGIFLKMNVGILTTVADALITEMTIQISINDEPKKSFKWAFISENVSTTNLTGDVMETKRNQFAIAYNLVKDTYNQPYISFYQVQHFMETDHLFPIITQRSFEYSQNGLDRKEIEQSKDYQDIITSFKKHWPMSEGTYDCVLKIVTMGGHSVSKKFSFYLNSTWANLFGNEVLEKTIAKLKNIFITDEANQLTFAETMDAPIPIIHKIY